LITRTGRSNAAKASRSSLDVNDKNPGRRFRKLKRRPDAV
jgi:hypothetical protein